MWKTCFILAALTCCLGSPAAVAGVTVEVDLGTPTVLAGDGRTAYLRIALGGEETKASRSRAPVNVAIVLDRSGSMGGEKIAEARRAAHLAIDRLRDDDIVSVVTYESTVHVLVPATRASDRRSIHAAIDTIEAGGRTALFAGVSKGAAELRKFVDDNRVNRIVLLSDGLANVGPSSPASLGDLGVSLSREGITVTTIGLGLQYNEDLMAQLAYTSDGNHFFVENAEDLELAWATEFGDVLSVVAKDVTVEVRFPRGVRPVRALGRDVSIDGQTMTASLNQIYRDQTKYLLLEVELPAGTAGATIPVARVDASYRDLTDGRRRTVRRGGSVSFTDSPAVVEHDTISEVMVDVVSQIAAERNELATVLRDEGKVKEAKNVLIHNAGYLEQNARKYDDDGLARDADTNMYQSDNLEGAEWQKTRKIQREYQLKTKQQASSVEPNGKKD